MSIAALVDQEIYAKEESAIQEEAKPMVARTMDDLKAEHRLSPQQEAQLEGRLNELARKPPMESKAGSEAINALTRFIPTEAITLYVAGVAALPAIEASITGLDAKTLYWSFTALTPILFIVLMMGKRRSQGLSLLPKPKRLPWFKLPAATVAFMVWALAIPSSPYLDGDSGKVVAAFGALLVSTFLTLLEPIFSPPKGPAS